MEAVRTPYLKVEIDGVDVTSDVSRSLLRLTYTDKVEGESDELLIEVEDGEGVWRGPWYPSKGAKLRAVIGYEDLTLDCGTFEIDEIEMSGPPDVMTIRALSAGISKQLRTKRSYAHEKKTLRQIALTVASRNGLEVQGEIPDVTFERVTQNRETDLAFLRRISSEYGCIFNVRSNRLVFTTIYAVEDRSPSTEIDRLDIATYSIKDKAVRTYKDAKVSYHNPDTKEVVSTTQKNADGYAYTQVAAADTKVLYTKAENKQQAELKAKAALHKANSFQKEGRLSLEGNPLLVAGNNFSLTGLGQLSGSYHITQSTHTIDRSSGYITDVDIKAVKPQDQAKQGSTKRGKEASENLRRPAAVSVTNAQVEVRQNADAYRFTQINP